MKPRHQPPRCKAWRCLEVQSGAVPVQLIPQAFDFIEDGMQFDRERPPTWRKLKVLMSFLEQVISEPVFEVFDMLANGTLADEQNLGGRCKTFLFRAFLEYFQSIQWRQLPHTTPRYAGK